MKTFAEWVEENHPEDEVLNEFLRDMARWVSDSKLGRMTKSAVLAGALVAGAAGRDAEGAMPMTPSATQGQDQGQYSDKPFSRDVGPLPANADSMSDFDLWHWQWKKISEIENEMSRHNMARNKGAMVGIKQWPMSYIKYGTHYGWKMPKPPERQGGGMFGGNK